jgi:hypothetical protein
MHQVHTMTPRSAVVALLGLAACGGSAPPPPAPALRAAPDAPGEAFGPLEIGADYATYRKVTRFPHESPTHGKRFVEIHVNDIGYDAYVSDDAPFPVGTIIVKASWERDGDQPSQVAGPVFVMEKREPGFAPDHEDWYYAIHWAAPTPAFTKRFGGPFYWRSPSPKVEYCWKCHDNYDREVGLPPKAARVWVEPEADARGATPGPTAADE